MKTRDLTELAARNLREAVLRNSLTTLGIAVGVASLVALLSLGVGLQQLVDRSVARAGLFDIISVRPRQNSPFGQPGGGRRTPPKSVVLPIDSKGSVVGISESPFASPFPGLTPWAMGSRPSGARIA